MKKDIEERVRELIELILSPLPTEEVQEALVQEYLPLYQKKGLSEDYLRGIYDGIRFVVDKTRGKIE